MRAWALVVVAGCGAAAPPTSAPATPPPAPTLAHHAELTAPAASAELAAPAAAAPPAPQPAASAEPAPQPASAFPTLDRPGRLVMLVVDGGPPHCEAWTVDPEHHRLVRTETRGPTTARYAVELHAEGHQLVFDSASMEGGDSASSTTCSDRRDAKETDAAIVADRLRWFRDPAACAVALREHARVATELACAIDEEVPARVQRVARARFETLLARGGVVHAIVDGPRGDTCRPVRVRHYGARGALEGAFEYDEVRDDGVRGVTSLDYQMRPGDNQITLLGPGTTWRDGSGFALGCGDLQHVELGDGFVTLAEPLYFTAAGCKAAIAAARARDTWLPLPAGDEVAEAPTALGTPGLGGC